MASGVLQKGTTVAGYRVDGILGQGGMGTVYEATQLSLERVVALKVLAAHLTDDLAFQQRFRREGQIQAAIDHPHIVTVYDSGQTEHGFFIAMRLVRGPNLKDMIVARELDAGRAIRIVTPIAEALDTSHAAGLIHRDIKPQNILVSGRDHAFLADFGLTKATGDKSMTRTGQFIGTLDYISPEQIRGDRAAIQSDVYALAAVMYECLTGVVPFPKESEAAVLYAHMSEPPPRVTDQRPELPGQLDEVLSRALAKDPAERPPSAGALMLEINQAFSRRVRAAFTPPGPIEVPEETGIRSAEVDVGTRESREPQPGETEPGKAGETIIAAGETAAGETAAPAPDETRIAPDETRIGAGETTARVSDETTTRAPGETRIGAEETRAAPAAGSATPPPSASRLTPPASELPTPRPDEAPAPRPRRPQAKAARAGIPSGVLVGAVALVAVLFVVGFLVGRSGSGDEGGANPQRVAGGPLALSPPSTWRAAGTPLAVPELRLVDGATVAPGGDTARGALAIGTTRASGSTLLPVAFVERLGGAPKRDDPVRLGDLQAYRYTGLRPRGFDRSVTVYVAPTTEGVATVVCAAPAAGGAGILADCERAATTLRLNTGKAFPLGGDPGYVDELGSTMDRLNATRRTQSRALREARTARGQAEASQRLAAAYRKVARSLAGAAPSPEQAPTNSRIVSALRDVAAAYQGLAAAARQVNRARYREAGRRVATGEAKLRRALASSGQG